MQVEPEYEAYIQQPSRDSEYRLLASEVVRHAFHDLQACEEWVQRHRQALEKLPAPKYRTSKLMRFAYEAAARIDAVRDDLAWFGTANYGLWTHWVDLDPDMMAAEYRGRATRLLNTVRELTRGGV